jgi:hypothetical protein
VVQVWGSIGKGVGSLFRGPDDSARKKTPDPFFQYRQPAPFPLCNREQAGCPGWTYADRVRLPVPGDTLDPVGRVERMIEHYHREKMRRLQRRALTLWRKLEARQALVKLDKPFARVH